MSDLLAILAQWLEPFIPSWRLVLWGAPLGAVYTGAAAALAGWLRTRREVKAPYTRKVFHFTIISAAAPVQLAWGLQATVVFGGVVAVWVLVAVALGDGFPFYEAMARPSDEPHRALFIVVPLLATAVGGVLSNLLFSPFAPVGYLVTAWGDAVGEPVGVRWGRHRYRVPSLAGVKATRSVEGSAAVLVVGTAAATSVLLGMGHPAGSGMLIGLACGALSTAVEALSSHGLDNLTVQIAASWVAWLALT